MPITVASAIGIQAAGELHQGNLIAADANRVPVAGPVDKVCGGGPQHEQARVLPGPQTRHVVLPGEEVERPRQRAAVVGQHRIIAPGHVPHDGKAAIAERPALAVELQAVGPDAMLPLVSLVLASSQPCQRRSRNFL